MILLIIGKSGSGKTAIMEELVRKHGYERVITCTTRKPREGEDESSYHFMTMEGFAAARGRGEFLECDVYNDNFYGTLKSEFEGADMQNKKVCVVTPEGAAAIKKAYPGTCIMYLFADLEDSVTRAIERLKGCLVPRDLMTIVKRAITDEYLYEGVAYDIMVMNRLGSKLYELADAAADEHMKWELHNSMQDTNKVLREGLEKLKKLENTREDGLPDRKRCMDLLKCCIDYVMKNNTAGQGIHELSKIGFTSDELVDAFGFTRANVDEVLK